MNIRYRKDLWKVIPDYGNAVEIGVAEGYFSADILEWPIHIPILYMVDRWKSVPEQKGDASNSQEWHDKNFEAAKLRVARFRNRAVFLRGDSNLMAFEVPDGTLSLVYIDGDHSYPGVTSDINSWLPKLMVGGVMAFHDYENPNYGVKQAVHDFCNRTGYTIRLLSEDKPEDAGAWIRC